MRSRLHLELKDPEGPKMHAYVPAHISMVRSSLGFGVSEKAQKHMRALSRKVHAYDGRNCLQGRRILQKAELNGSQMSWAIRETKGGDGKGGVGGGGRNWLADM